MISDKEEIERILKNGRSILFERPELANMSYDDILNKLDDGTQQMMRERWGVVAWLVIDSITEFGLTELVDYLSKIKSGILTYEYVGYLLCTEYDVSLESLILEAERCGQFDKIVPYVSTNLKYQSKVCTQVQQILIMLENHLTHPSYVSFITNYSEHFADLGAQLIVEERLGDLSGQAQYDLMRNLRWSWYRKDPVEASEVIGRMMARRSIWSKKAAIDFLEVSLYYDGAVFHNKFLEIKNMIAMNEELSLMIIPVFIKYVLKANAEEALDNLYYQVLEYLKMIPSKSINAKCSFLASIQQEEDIPVDLQSIFHAVISSPCSKDPRLLHLLDQNLYVRSKKGEWQAALQVMLEAFSAGKYLTNYNTFFNAMNLVNDLISKHANEVTIQALKYMLSCDVNQIFFGLGLLMNIGELNNTQSENSAGSCFINDITDSQMIRLMKAILYYGFDAQKICQMAFQFLILTQKPNEKYIDFCMKEIYRNYPATMYKVTALYKDSHIIAQSHLAEKVLKSYGQLSEEQKQGYKIKDLQPSREHQYIYHRAQVEENRRISKRADEQSPFADLFTRKSMKYGVRSAFIINERKGQKRYQVNPYQQFKYEIELPVIYINDPVGYEIQRRAYLSEVMNDAANNQGSSAPNEGER